MSVTERSADTTIDQQPRHPTSERVGYRRPWLALRQFGSRFVCAYLVLYTFPGIIGYLRFDITQSFSQWYFDSFVGLAYWTEVHLFGLATPVPFAFTGSSDTLARYATQVDVLLLTIVVAVGWSIAFRHRVRNARMHEWLRVWVRLNLATFMLGYGFAKVFQTQFGSLSLERYMQPLGEYSPMGLLWTFMSYSPSYNLFGGAVEVVGALLLVFRRTATLGALILVGTMANVAMLNFAYDVPVKIFSLNLLLMAVFIAAPDISRLVNVLLLDRPTSPREVPALFNNPRLKYAAPAVAMLLIGYIVWIDVAGELSTLRDRRSSAAAAVLRGIYDVETFHRNGAVSLPLLSDSMRWRRVIFSDDGRVALRTMSDSVERYVVAVDTVRRALTFTRRAAPKLTLTMTYDQPDHDHVVLQGNFGGDSIVARLRRFDEAKLLLKRSGFRWIQERPFNR